MSSDPRISIRPARPADREAVLAFSQNTFEWGDYLPPVWDDWLEDKSGRLLVATIRKQPVAVGRVALLSPTEAWFEGLRVDPAYRKQGIATVLTRRCLEEARQLGATVVRFVTAATNYPIHRLAPTLGFERIFTMSPYRAGGLRGGPAVTVPKVKDVPRLLAFLRGSEALTAMRGLCNLGWRFQALTEDVLKERVKRRRLRMIEGRTDIAALAMTVPSFRRQGLSIGYVDGRPEALRALLSGLRAERAACESPEVAIWVPEVPWLRRTLFEAGFTTEAGRGFWVYQSIVDSRQSDQSSSQAV